MTLRIAAAAWSVRFVTISRACSANNSTKSAWPWSLQHCAYIERDALSRLILRDVGLVFNRLEGRQGMLRTLQCIAVMFRGFRQHLDHKVRRIEGPLLPYKGTLTFMMQRWLVIAIPSLLVCAVRLLLHMGTNASNRLGFFIVRSGKVW